MTIFYVSCSKKVESNQVSKKETKNETNKVDFDLTKWNYNMLTGLNFDMAVDTEKYIGKTMKIRGQFFSVIDPNTEQRYYSCLVYDETACCQVGLDFVLSGDKKYPDDYPPEKTEIEICGTYSTIKNTDSFSYEALLIDEITIIGEKND